MNEGEDLNAEIEQAQPRPIKEIIASLRAKPFDYMTQKREFLVSINTHPIEEEDIKELLTFPFENAFVAQKEQVVMRTGNEKTVSFATLRRDKELDATYIMHTHPSELTVPSFKDVELTDSIPPTTTQILVHREGIMVYQKPRYDPIRQSEATRWTTDLIIEYMKHHGVDIAGLDPHLKNYQTLSNA